MDIIIKYLQTVGWVLVTNNTTLLRREVSREVLTQRRTNHTVETGLEKDPDILPDIE